MPKDRTIRVLYKNYDLVKPVPATYDELDEVMGEVGGGLADSVDNLIARNFLPRVYAAAAEELTSLGHPHKQIGTKKAVKEGAAETPVFESDIEHVDRIRHDGDDAVKATVASIVKKHFDALPLYAERTGGGGAGRIATDALEGSNAFFAKGADTVEKVAAHIEGFVPGYTVLRDSSGSPTPESLARAIMAMNRKIEDDAKKASASALAGIV